MTNPENTVALVAALNVTDYRQVRYAMTADGAAIVTHEGGHYAALSIEHGCGMWQRTPRAAAHDARRDPAAGWVPATEADMQRIQHARWEIEHARFCGK